jgi:Leucine-rich repeat (LRR) protein
LFVFLTTSSGCSVQYLYLGGNNLEELDPRIFESYPSLSWLDVRDNRLTSFPAAVKEHPGLKTLLLGGNYLRALPNELGIVFN